MSQRLAFLGSFLIVICLLIFSLYLEYFVGEIPCPLCSLQRLTFIFLGLLFFIGIVNGKKKWHGLFLNILVSVTTLIGLIFSGRQIWMQQFPVNNSGDCSMSLSYLFETLPLNQLLEKVLLEGGSECSKKGFSFLYFNIAEWSFIWFFLFLVLSIYLFLQQMKQR